MSEQVKRYTIAAPVPSRMNTGGYDVVHTHVVLAQDFDTLARRLQEAERLLSCAKQYELGPTLNSMIDTFLLKKETK